MEATDAIPVIDGFGIEDVREIAVAPWARTGGKAAFLNLYGMEGVTGMYVGEIPAGAALNPEKHFYEEVIVILAGQAPRRFGKRAAQSRCSNGVPGVFSRRRSILTIGCSTAGAAPVKYLAVTNAPLVMDIVHNEEFVFNCPYSFCDRYTAADGYFNQGLKL